MSRAVPLGRPVAPRRARRATSRTGTPRGTVGARAKKSFFNAETNSWESAAEHEAHAHFTSQSTEILIFPDAVMPCRSMLDANYRCAKAHCDKAHHTTSLVKFIRTLDKATSTLDVVCFTITCDDIKRAIQRAAKRGIRVRIVTDANNVDSLGSDIRELSEARKIDVRCDAHSNDPNKRGMMHHKFAIIDGETNDPVVITGSFNWTRAGVLDNHDNVLIARNQPDVAAPYIKHMEALWKEYAAFQIHGAEG